MSQSLSADVAAHAQTNITRYWNERAEPYDDFQTRRLHREAYRAAWRAVWAQHLPPAPARILDAGTGPGHMAHIMADLGHRVVGIDAAEAMVARAQRHAGAGEPAPEFLRGDAVAPDFAPASFDAVTSRYVLWTLRTPDAALANWRRLLRPGGRLVCVDSTWFPNGVQHGGIGDESFRARYTEEVLSLLPLAEASTIEDTAAAFRRAGFGDTTVTPLPDLLELDRRHGVAPNHVPRLQFAISAVRD